MVPLRKDYLKQYLKAVSLLAIIVVIPVCTLSLGLDLIHEGYIFLGGISLTVFTIATLWIGYQAIFMMDYMQELEDDDD